MMPHPLVTHKAESKSCHRGWDLILHPGDPSVLNFEEVSFGGPLPLQHGPCPFRFLQRRPSIPPVYLPPSLSTGCLYLAFEKTLGSLEYQYHLLGGMLPA